MAVVIFPGFILDIIMGVSVTLELVWFWTLALWWSWVVGNNFRWVCAFSLPLMFSYTRSCVINGKVSLMWRGRPGITGGGGACSSFSFLCTIGQCHRRYRFSSHPVTFDCLIPVFTGSLGQAGAIFHLQVSQLRVKIQCCNQSECLCSTGMVHFLAHGKPSLHHEQTLPF